MSVPRVSKRFQPLVARSVNSIGTVGQKVRVARRDRARRWHCKPIDVAEAISAFVATLPKAARGHEE